MANKIRLGFVGANVNSTWASQSPLSGAAGQSGRRAGRLSAPRGLRARRRLAKPSGRSWPFMTSGEMAVSAEIDAVAVVVRVPLHYEPTKAAIEAGKHVFTEWPFGTEYRRG